MKISNPSLSVAPAAKPGTTATSLPTIKANTALFLDFDGTLVDIAAQPDLVTVPRGLVDLLAQLSEQLNGALAIVSGRPLADLDTYLAPLKLPLAAEHGAIFRFANGQPIASTPPALHDVIRVASALAGQHAGLKVEIKSHAVALHYRHAPELERLCLEAMAEAIKRSPGLELLCGKFVFDIKPSGITKGTAIQALMDQPPFKGRVPWFAGDDTTDEAGFAAVQSSGGETIKIGAGASLAYYRCADPVTLRQWLAYSAERLRETEELGKLGGQQA